MYRRLLIVSIYIINVLSFWRGIFQRGHVAYCVQIILLIICCKKRLLFKSYTLSHKKTAFKVLLTELTTNILSRQIWSTIVLMKSERNINIYYQIFAHLADGLCTFNLLVNIRVKNVVLPLAFFEYFKFIFWLVVLRLPSVLFSK